MHCCADNAQFYVVTPNVAVLRNVAEDCGETRHSFLPSFLNSTAGVKHDTKSGSTDGRFEAYKTICSGQKAVYGETKDEHCLSMAKFFTADSSPSGCHRYGDKYSRRVHSRETSGCLLLSAN